MAETATALLRRLRAKLVSSWLAAMIVAVACSAAVGAERAEEELAEAIQERVAELHELMRERREAGRDHERQMQRVAGQVERLEADLAESASAERERREAVDQLAAEVAGLEKEQEALTAQLAAVADASQPAARQMGRRVAGGIPFRRGQRTAAIEHVVATLADDDAVERAAGVADFWSLMGDELQLAGSVDFWNDAVDLPDDRRHHAYLARLGLVQQVFLTEDGRVAGLAAMNAEALWRTALTEDEQRQARQAIAILQQRQPPQILPIPLTAPAKVGDE